MVSSLGRFVPLLFIGMIAVAHADPFIKYIHEFQSASGGFHDLGQETPDLQATAHALFLTSLYGLRTAINADDAEQYVNNLRNANDHGYGLSSGLPSDLEATRYALLSYLHLGKPIPFSSEVSDFVRSLFNVNTGLFASRVGDGGDLRSTALAIEALDMTGELQKPFVQEMLKRTKDVLSEKVVSTETSIHFSLDSGSTTPVSDNYYAIYLAKKSGFKFTDVEKWAAYITGLQDLDRQSPTFGGFSASDSEIAVTAEATAHAALSLNLLGVEAGQEIALYHYTQSRKQALKDSSLSHLAVAHTKLFKHSFTTLVDYASDSDKPITEQVMEGLHLTPHAVVSLFEGKVRHGGFSVVVKEASGWSSELVFNTDVHAYVAKDTFDTTDVLGPVSFTYEFSANVYPIGEIKLSTTDDKRIGFLVNLEESAVFGGRNIETGDNVLPGTEFEFELTFSTQSKQNFFSGDFNLDFSVVDSSGVTQHTSSVDGSSSSKAIAISYSLTGEDFPSGDVSFVFEVRNANGVHTRRTSKYTLDQQMVASSITFDGAAVAPKYKLGDTIKVSIEPGYLKDLHTISGYSAANTNSRRIVMDVAAGQNEPYLSINGIADGSAYVFDGALPSTFNAIGKSIVSFRYVSESGKSFALHPFDTESHELYEDASSLAFDVDAELHLSSVTQQPTQQDFTYGTSAVFKFKITDSISGQDVLTSRNSEVAIVLTSGSYESSRVDATLDDSHTYEATLEIDVNTAEGAGSIAIKVSAYGQDIPLLKEGASTETVSYPATVGGKIDVSSNSYSTSSLDATKTAVITTFTLSCQDNPLRNALLKANVLSKSGSEFSVVNTNGVSLSQIPVAFNQAAQYSLSFTSPHDQLASGTYKIEFFRESDLARADSNVKPLFSIEVAHEKVESTGLWMQMELVTLLILGALYWGVSSHARMFGQDSKKFA